MKACFNYLTVIFMLMASQVSAQWSVDPDNPMIVCDAPDYQQSVLTVDDGSTGRYVFWLDSRAGGDSVRVYGQYFDIDGMPQWPIDGKLIIDDNNIQDLQVARTTTGILYFVYLMNSNAGYPDTVRVLKTDATATPLWASPADVFGFVNNQVLGPGTSRILISGGNIYVGNITTYFGGSSNLRINKVDASGNVLWGFNGNAVPSSGYGGMGLAQDGSGGAFIYWRSANGAGSPLMAQRMDPSGNFLWSSNLDVSGLPGLAYAYAGIYDNYGMIFTWVESGGNIQMSRVDTAGNFTWTPAKKPVCMESNNQDSPVITKNGSSIFVAWADSRPPANYADVYMQKFNGSGQPQWTLDGIKCSSLNTYIPTVKIVPSDSGSVIFAYQSSSLGFHANRIRSDSTKAWGPDGVKMCISALNPFYSDFSLAPTPQNGAMAFWSTQSTVYGAAMGQNGVLLNNFEPASTTNDVMVFPNPGSDIFTMQFNTPVNEDLNLQVFSLAGEKLIERNLTEAETQSGNTDIDLDKMASGIYFCRLSGNQFNKTIKLIKQ